MGPSSKFDRQGPRICISLTEVSVEPSQWIASEKDCWIWAGLRIYGV